MGETRLLKFSFTGETMSGTRHFSVPRFLFSPTQIFIVTSNLKRLTLFQPWRSIVQNDKEMSPCESFLPDGIVTYTTAAIVTAWFDPNQSTAAVDLSLLRSRLPELGHPSISSLHTPILLPSPVCIPSAFKMLSSIA